jgi:hypothetical protein
MQAQASCQFPQLYNVTSENFNRYTRLCAVSKSLEKGDILPGKASTRNLICQDAHGNQVHRIRDHAYLILLWIALSGWARVNMAERPTARGHCLAANIVA